MLNNYKKSNDIIGWIVFGISLIVYMLTVAPTASFWDCGEFISCSNELQVPHPPGPPVYLFIGRVFAMLAMGNLENIAYMVNLFSVFASAFTVLFSFWTITILAKKMLAIDEINPSSENTIAIMFAGAVGALACGFADSVWFNAVEAEVYAVSSLCTAAVIWLIFKWEARADEPDNLKWIILIAFVIGLSVGVHLLNLLAIPGLAYVYYWKKYEFSWVGFFVTGVVGVVLLGVVQVGVIQWTIEYVWAVEKFLVGYLDPSGRDGGGLGFPVGSGIAVSIVALMVAITGGIYYTNKKGMVIANTALLSLTMIMIGYSTYTIIVIRANSDVPINENDPSNMVSLLSYMKREQYGDRPLLSGPLYNNVNKAKRVNGREKFMMYKEADWFIMEDGSYKTKDGVSFKVKKGSTSSKKVTGKTLEDGTKLKVDRKGKALSFRIPNIYIKAGYKTKYEYDKKYKKFFPRMYSSAHYDSKKHLYGYKKFVKNLGADKKNPADDKPTDAEDMKFFWEYQIQHMYNRYFGWNFIGRQSDRQNDGIESGWGFSTISEMSDEMKNHQGKNHYFALPFLLGLFGLVWHFFGRPKDATSIGMLFLFAGLAIIIYLNQPPSQPRERDYSYAGSFQVFAFWIGLGVIGLYDLLKDYLGKITSITVGTVSMILVPGLMLVQNWDDHNRHLRYVAPDSAYNLLNSCAENAILFTNGDNDTFPLWYLQEVENVRSDVRVVNLSLLNTDWYVSQMRKKANLSEPLPITLREVEYTGDANAYKLFKKQTVNIPVNKAELIKNGVVSPEDAHRIVSPMPWEVRTRGGSANSYLLKQDYMIKDVLFANANNGWKRPIYFSSTIPPSSYVGLTDYFQVEGLAYRVLPLTKGNNGPDDRYTHGTVNEELSYDLIVNKFKYRELDNPKLYIDEHIRKTIIGNIRSTIFRVANKFIFDRSQLVNLKNGIAKGTVADSVAAKAGNIDARIKEYEGKAIELMDLSLAKIPANLIEMDPVFHLFMGEAYDRIGQTEKRNAIYQEVEKRVMAALEYVKATGNSFKNKERYENSMHLLSSYYQKAGETDTALEVISKLIEVTGKAEYESYRNFLNNQKSNGKKPVTTGTPGK